MANQQNITVSVGFDPNTPNVGYANALTNAAANWVAFSFLAQAATSLSTFRFRCTAKNGTGGTITCGIYSDSNGNPNTGAAAVDTLTVGSISASAWVDCTGGSVSLTKGTKYWVVLKNTDGSPSTNNITIGTGGGNTGLTQSADDTATTANSGSTWSTNGKTVGARFGFGDSTYSGSPVSNITVTSGTQAVYSSNECGMRFTTPANGSMVLAGLCGFWNTGGTPTGDLFFKLYDASHNLLGKTYSVVNGEAKARVANWIRRYFDPTSISGGASTITLSPSTTYTVTYAETTQSDTTSNQFRPYIYTWDSDSNSLALVPWSWQADIFNGGSWTQTTTLIVPVGLLLSTGAEFAASGGSGGRRPKLVTIGV